MRWAIYYHDGRVARSEDFDWCSAPVEGVLAVVEESNGSRTIRSGGDYYRLEDQTVICTEDAAALLRAIGCPGLRELGSVKFGRFTSAHKMEQMFRRIREEWGV